MAISIKGVNTGVIRKSNNFIALALKIKEPRNKESLFFLSVMELRDLLIALESRLHQKHKLDAAARLQYEQARDKVIKKMAENIPEILVDELKNADINRRVNTLELTDNQGENLTFVLTLHDGSKCELVINELQIEMLARAIIHAINNAEMRELALRITSLLDFLPLYDVDCQDNGNLEYDTYSQPEWKHNLFNHYLAVLYRFKDESGKEQFSGAVVKTREATPGKEVEAITRRMLDFSPRLKKLAGVPCQVYVRTVAANNAQPLTQDTRAASLTCSIHQQNCTTGEIISSVLLRGWKYPASGSHQFGHLYTWPIIWLSVGTKLDNIPCDGLLMP